MEKDNIEDIFIFSVWNLIFDVQLFVDWDIYIFLG